MADKENLLQRIENVEASLEQVNRQIRERLTQGKPATKRQQDSKAALEKEREQILRDLGGHTQRTEPSTNKWLKWLGWIAAVIAFLAALAQIFDIVIPRVIPTPTVVSTLVANIVPTFTSTIASQMTVTPSPTQTPVIANAAIVTPILSLATDTSTPTESPTPTPTSTELPISSPVTVVTPPEITSCLPFTDYVLPTPIAQQPLSSQQDNYLIYASNMENWEYDLEQKRWESSPYWGASNIFLKQLEVHNESSSKFITPDNRDPREGNYSVCIQAPPSTIAPNGAEFAYPAQTFPANTKLGLSFYYRTYGEPNIVLQFPTDNKLAVDPTSVTLISSTVWISKEIVFVVDQAPDQVKPCDLDIRKDEPRNNKPKLEIPSDLLVGCVGLRFVVAGEGVMWLDDVRVD